MSLAKRAYNGHISIRTGPWSSGRRLPGQLNHMGVDGQVACVSFTWGRDGTRMQYEKKTSQQRQYDVFGQCPVGKPWDLPFMWMLIWSSCLDGSGLFW